MNQDIINNDVPSENQVYHTFSTEFEPGAALKVLFVGNSITIHEPNADLGWYGCYGMAASCRDNDYVHVAKKLIKEKYGSVSIAVLHASAWERSFWQSDALDRDDIRSAREFEPDVAVIRIGENAHTFVTPKHDFKIGYERFVKYLCPNPKTKIIVTDQFWQCEKLDNPIKVLAAENGWQFVHIGDLGQSDENKAIGLFEHGGVASHPGDLGMKRIAERIAEHI